MLGLVHRRIGAAVLGLCLACLGAGIAPAQEIKTAAQFTVSLGPLRAGVLWLDGSTSSRAYTATSGFQSTGLIRGIANISVTMSARGRVSRGALVPARYTEEVTVGRSSGAIVMDYVRGVPRLSGQKIRDDDDAAPKVDPATQSGTLDPLTATFALLRAQPVKGACQVDRFMFDGERRTRVVMTDLRQEGEDWLCSGQFLRLEGYTPRDLQRSGQVDVTVRYRQSGDLLYAVEARFASLRGVVRLTRR